MIRWQTSKIYETSRAIEAARKPRKTIKNGRISDLQRLAQLLGEDSKLNDIIEALDNVLESIDKIVENNQYSAMQ